MNFLLIISSLAVLIANIQSAPAAPPAGSKTDLCAFQANLNTAIGGLSSSGQQIARQILLDVQHELGKVLQNTYAQIKKDNSATLEKLKAAEGENLNKVFTAIGFNNETAFSGSQVDLCQIQTDGVAAFSKLSNSTQSKLMKIAKAYLEKAKPQLQGLSNTIMSKDQGLIMQLYKTEKMDKLMALANLLQTAMSLSSL
jgi:hypothetical protein